MKWGLLVGLGLLLLSGGVRAQQSKNPESTKAELMRADREFSKMSQAKGMVESFDHYLASDATIFPMNERAVSGKAAIRSQLARSNGVLTWEPTAADISASADLGYTFGTYEFKTSGADGKPVSYFGKYVSIWKKQPDGAWKIVIDIGNPGPSPTVTP